MARIRVRRRAGEPGIIMPRQNWPSQRQPMRAIRSVRTLIKRDEAKGITQPEFKDTLQRAGVGSRVRPKVLSRQKPDTPPASGSGTRRVKTPSPTNGAGIKRMFP